MKSVVGSRGAGAGDLNAAKPPPKLPSLAKEGKKAVTPLPPVGEVG